MQGILTINLCKVFNLWSINAGNSYDLFNWNLTAMDLKTSKKSETSNNSKFQETYRDPKRPQRPWGSEKATDHVIPETNF